MPKHRSSIVSRFSAHDKLLNSTFTPHIKQYLAKLMYIEKSTVSTVFPTIFTNVAWVIQNIKNCKVLM